MTTVSDSSPLIVFSKAGGLWILHELFGEILIPPTVHLEVSAKRTNRPDVLDPGDEPWIRICRLAPSDAPRAWLEELDPGEAEAIALAAQLGRDVTLLLDDRRGRRLARAHGLEVVGSAGTLVLAKTRGLIPAVKPVLDELRLVGLSLGDEIDRRVLVLADEEPQDLRSWP
ncbi:MAG: DUF3368 domain-containing protein [Chloroflexota bacterium]